MVDSSWLFIVYEYVKQLAERWNVSSLLAYSNTWAAVFAGLFFACLLLSVFLKEKPNPNRYSLKSLMLIFTRFVGIFAVFYCFWGNRNIIYEFVEARMNLTRGDTTAILVFGACGLTGLLFFILAISSSKTPNNDSELNARQKNFTVSLIAGVIFLFFAMSRYANGVFTSIMTLFIVTAEIVSVVFWFYDPILYILSHIRFFQHRKKQHACKPTPGKINRFAVIGCAHNEETVIGHLVESLLATTYPKDMFDIYVICDNCSDSTADVVRKSGAIAMERNDPDRRGKGYGLEWMFAHLTKWREEGNAYDAYIVLDADNLVNERYLDLINDRLNEGNDIMQTYLGCKNPTDTWISKCYSMAYWLSNSNYQHAHSRLGLSAQMGGTGMVLRPSVLQDVGWRTDSLTEDLVLTANYTLTKNMPCVWVHNARLYDEKPLNLKPSIKQRTRWMQGHNNAMWQYAPQLLYAAIKNRSFVQLDMAFYLMRPFLNFCLFVLYLVRIIGVLFLPGTILATSFLMNAQTSTLLLLSYTLIQLYILSEENYLHRFIWIPLQWIFTYTWYPAFFKGIVKNKERYWVSTVHNRNISIKEVQEDILLVDARKRLEGLDNLHRLPLGQILLKAAVITNAQLQQALDIQKQSGGLLGDIVLKMNALTPDVLSSYLSLQKTMKENAADKNDETLQLGSILIAAGLITEDQLTQALAYQKKHGGFLGDCLIKINCLTPDLLNFFLSVQKVFDENYLSIEKSERLIRGLVANGSMPFGEVLFRGGLISKQQLELAMELKEKKNILTGQALLELGYINERTLFAILQIQKISRAHLAAKQT